MAIYLKAAYIAPWTGKVAGLRTICWSSLATVYLSDLQPRVTWVLVVFICNAR